MSAQPPNPLPPLKVSRPCSEAVEFPGEKGKHSGKLPAQRVWEQRLQMGGICLHKTQWPLLLEIVGGRVSLLSNQTNASASIVWPSFRLLIPCLQWGWLIFITAEDLISNVPPNDNTVIILYFLLTLVLAYIAHSITVFICETFNLIIKHKFLKYHGKYTAVKVFF